MTNFRILYLRRVLLSGLAALVLAFIPALSQSNLGTLDSNFEEDLVAIQAVSSYSAHEIGGDYMAAIVVDIKQGWHINSASPFQDWLIPAALRADSLESISLTVIQYPDGHTIRLLDENMSVYDGRVIIPFQVTIDSNAQAGMHNLPLHFTFQPCNDKECRAPQELSTALALVVGETGQPINTSIFSGVTLEEKSVDSQPSAAPDSDIQQLIDKHGNWGYVLALGLAFVTGLLLSFSPCTYPMIPITVSIFAGRERSLGRGFVLSLFYVGTMAVIYGIMGLVVSLAGGVFGAWLASPPVVIGIAIIFTVFALSMFGLFEINVPLSLRSKLGATKTSGGVAGAMVLGVIAALVVSPCVGPFVAGILLYIATFGSPVFGFLTLFIFALGLGTLYILIGTFSSAISALPGSGAWMETVKKFFGFVLLFMALYFLNTIISENLIISIAGLLLLALAVFGGGFDRLTSESPVFDRLRKYVGLLAFVVGLYLLMGGMLRSGFILPPISEWLPVASSGPALEDSTKLINWETDLEAGLARAKQEGRPVLIDTWATWCVNCRILEKRTFRNPIIVTEAERYVSLKIQLEKYDSPETKEFMRRFDLKSYSLPTTVLLDSQGRVQRFLQGVVEPEEMLLEMRKVN